MTQQREIARALLPHLLAAGRTVMSHFRRGCEVSTKTGGSPVTQADRDGEEILLAGLAEIAPGVPVIAEEMAGDGLPSTLASEFFLVDALDGTREFTTGWPEFTLNVGLVSGGTPVFGMIYAPALSRLYVTLAPDHSMTADLSPDQPLGSLGELDGRRMRVRDFAHGEALVLATSRSHGSDALEAWLKDKAIAERITIGSSLKFCHVASGEAHIYPRFGPTMEWDTAAGHAIVLAAGGCVIDTQGAPLLYGKLDRAFCNPHFIAAAAPLAQFRDGPRPERDLH